MDYGILNKKNGGFTAPILLLFYRKLLESGEMGHSESGENGQF